MDHVIVALSVSFSFWFCFYVFFNRLIMRILYYIPYSMCDISYRYTYINIIYHYLVHIIDRIFDDDA